MYGFKTTRAPHFVLVGHAFLAGGPIEFGMDEPDSPHGVLYCFSSLISTLPSGNKNPLRFRSVWEIDPQTNREVSKRPLFLLKKITLLIDNLGCKKKHSRNFAPLFDDA